MTKIAIYGGSFNPIHHGHIALARQVIRKELADEVWFMVSPVNPFKKDQQTSLLDDEQRYQLVCKAVERKQRLVASDFEFSLPKPSYTWRTMRALREAYPDNKFSLLIGADNWIKFDRWANSEELLQNYEILVYPRIGYNIAEHTLPENVHLIGVKTYDVSSTEIRQRIMKGQSVREFLPTAAADDIIRIYTEFLNKPKPKITNKKRTKKQ